jgi:hypothetical protein
MVGAARHECVGHVIGRRVGRVPWFALASLAQLAVLARIAGRFSPLATVVYPVLTAFFVAVVVRSIARRARGGAVTWKGGASAGSANGLSPHVSSTQA